MNAFIFPIKTALLTFPILALFFTLPFLIHQYRKYRYINKFRAFMLYSFLLFLITSYYLVILPLPKTRDVKSLQLPGTRHYNLIPFTFIQDFLNETQAVFNTPSTYLKVLRERAFLQAAFNGILLAPLGIYLRYYFKKNLKQTIIICFLYSLFFELTQFSGLYGFYNAPYRLLDVDDLILNTFGGFLGYLIAPIFTYFMPNIEKLDEGVDLETMSVGYIRRFIALQIDWIILKMILALLPIKENILAYASLIFLYFIVLMYFTNGQTAGKWLLKIKVRGKNDKISLLELIKRYGILYYGIFGINYVLSIGFTANTYTNNLNQMIPVVILFVLCVFDFLLFLHVLFHVFKKDKELFYEKVSKTRVIIETK